MLETTSYVCCIMPYADHISLLRSESRVPYVGVSECQEENNIYVAVKFGFSDVSSVFSQKPPQAK